jgi:type I restriction enzyme S subunit
MTWRRVRLDWITSTGRVTVDPENFGTDQVVHYSIPALDEFGGPRIEETTDIASAKLLVRPGEILVSKLNPRKLRVVTVCPHELPAVASTEFIPLRPHGVEPDFLKYWLQSERTRQSMDGAVQSVTRSHQRISPDELTKKWLDLPPVEAQRAIIDYLDNETFQIDALIAKKRAMLRCLEERISAMVGCSVGASSIAGGATPAVEIRRVLRKVRTPAETGEIVTAYRDGQVTARSIRRAEGYTESSADNTGYQRVRIGDVVVHGLDGFAGAIGTSEADGICSPVYHVMRPTDRGDSEFYGRLLHELAVTNYLGLFATSTRERAVDFRNWALFGRIPIPMLTVEEQRRIGEMIRAIRPLKAAVAKSETLATERRQALITAAVAGELSLCRSA